MYTLFALFLWATGRRGDASRWLRARRACADAIVTRRQRRYSAGISKTSFNSHHHARICCTVYSSTEKRKGRGVGKSRLTMLEASVPLFLLQAINLPWYPPSHASYFSPPPSNTLRLSTNTFAPAAGEPHVTRFGKRARPRRKKAVTIVDVASAPVWLA